MNRADPSIATDGQGVQVIDLSEDFQGLVQYKPFEDSLTPFMQDGFKV
jgi:hypothetical protein